MTVTEHEEIVRRVTEQRDLQRVQCPATSLSYQNKTRRDGPPSSVMRTTTPQPASRKAVIEMARAEHTAEGRTHQRAQARAVPRAARKIQVRLKEHHAVQPSPRGLNQSEIVSEEAPTSYRR